ncbi:MAG TPA: helix-turn-helix domain-containing protein [Gemmatimonadales bacterium]|nr:helix-turn-helix domain-containing protein [Gemmatimonadales bacterium]
MSVTPWDSRFFESTRGRVLALLRRGSRTVDELAAELGLTDNAVRTHIALLERDGLVEQRGLRPTGGKPAYAYEVTVEAERLLTKAYIPVLTQLVGVLEERLTAEGLKNVLREVGRRLAALHRSAPGDVRAKAEAAAAVLNQLGGVVEVEETADGLALRSRSCPLADAVRSHPATCQATESMVAELVGVPVRERCEKGERPKCRFELGAPPDQGPAVNPSAAARRG